MRDCFNILVTIAVLILLTSCGIKPSAVEPQPGAESKVYPRTYPDISNDPRPYSP